MDLVGSTVVEIISTTKTVAILLDILSCAKPFVFMANLSQHSFICFRLTSNICGFPSALHIDR